MITFTVKIQTLKTAKAQWLDRVTKPLRAFSNIETFLDFLNTFGYRRSFIRVRAILEQDLHALIHIPTFVQGYGKIYHAKSKSARRT